MSIDTYRDSNGEIYRSQYMAKIALAQNPDLRMFKHSLSMAGTRIEDVTDQFRARLQSGSAPTTNAQEG